MTQFASGDVPPALRWVIIALAAAIVVIRIAGRLRGR
jgi:hypothetical protein